MVFVLDADKRPLAPCHEARARKLLSHGKAKVYRREPFTIILKRVVDDPVIMNCTLKIDPGSRHTGLAIMRGPDVLWLGQIEHRTDIKEKLEKRSSYRRRRRGANLRYRKPRSLNRKKPKGWFPPTVMSRLQNVLTVVKRLMKLCPIGDISYELVKFDIFLMEHPDAQGAGYQQGPLYRTEMRTFLLDRFGAVCQYCGGKSGDTHMEWEHIIPKSQGGTNTLKNATLACHACNQAKGNMSPKEWAVSINKQKKISALDRARLAGIATVQEQSYEKSLAGATITNSIRKKLKTSLETTGLPVMTSPARNTKYNRVQRGLNKEHCIDAACVGDDIPKELHFKTDRCLVITAKGRGSHCRTNVDRFGSPKGRLPRQKMYFGFQTGDIVVANVPSGKKEGRYVGRVSCRTTGSFNITTGAGRIQGISYKYMKLIQKGDGYMYDPKIVQIQKADLLEKSL